MAMYTARPVANGLRTDHPIPDLPFVDDHHLPLDDPEAIEAIGRGKADDMHGREDRCDDGGWLAITTDPMRHDLAWVVRWHPDHGYSVVLYRDDDAFGLHTVMMFEAPSALLFRSGGYWWDGATWYRPAQVWDGAAEQYYRRPVPAAVTVTADALLQGGDPARGRLLTVTEVDVDAAPPERWRDDLAMWATSYRDGGGAGGVVTFTAPELTGDQLVGVPEMAQIAGIGASTLRAYVSRGEGDVPLPQATINGRNMWARPVAEEWAEQRRRSGDGLIEAVAADRDHSNLPLGVADVWARYTRTFFGHLWSPSWRKRWSLRWRTEASVRDVAETLSWEVAAGMTKLIPVHNLASTIRQALLCELDRGKRLHHAVHREPDDPYRDKYQYFGMSTAVTKTLDWLIRHDPATAGLTIEQTIGDAEREFEIPRSVSEQSIRKALAVDGTLDEQTLQDFLERVLAPEADSSAR
jgi:hypothetical protein